MSTRMQLGPLDSEGVRFDRPPSQVKWSEITNFVIQEGRLVSRPGFEIHNHGGANDVPSVQPSPILSMVEIFNPGSSATGRESFTPKTEALVPNATTTVVAGWSGTHADIDEGVPDAVDVMSTATLGAAAALDFTNPAITFNFVLGVTFHVRARINATGDWAKLNFYFGNSTAAANLIHSEVITVREEAEGDDWQDFYFSVSRDLNSDRPLVQADLTALKLTMELDSAEAFQGEWLLADGNGSHQEWLDAVDGGTAVFGDCTGLGDYVHTFSNSNLPTNQYIRDNGDDTRQTFTFTTARTFATIQRVQASGYFRKPGGRALDATAVGLIVDDVAADHEATSNVEFLAGSPGRIMTTEWLLNPKTGAAWTTAQIDTYEFGVKKVSGAELACGLFSLFIYGTRSGGTTVQVDTINAQISGTANNNQSSSDKERLFSSNLWHNRYDSDVRNPTITDVTNSVPLNSTGPGWPQDHTVLYGQAYIVNGVDPTVYYPDGSNTFSELATNNADGATALTGRCTASFGERLFYGWVKDNATITPERISYSKWRDGQTHNHRSAGDFDLLDTPGGVVAMVPLDEQDMAVLKEKGAYVVRRTGNDVFPFIRDVIDFEVSCIATRTAVRAQFAEGSAILFLGTTPTYGVNVYMFDGSSVQPVGMPIARKLREDMNNQASRLSAHAQIDARTGTYWLFVPEGTDGFPQQAWVMNLQTAQWTRAEFPFDVYSSGNWHFPDRTWLDIESATATIGGLQRLVLGTGSQYLPMAGFEDLGYDELTHPSGDVNFDDEDFVYPFEQGRLWRTFTPKLTTGDLIKPADMEAVSYRIGMLYLARNPVNRVLVSASEDGGISWSTEQETWFGVTNENSTTAHVATGGTYYAELDMEPTHAPQIRYRLRFESEVSTFDGTNEFELRAPQLLEIHDMWITTESGADSE